jgi:hypothetical protein
LEGVILINRNEILEDIIFLCKSIVNLKNELNSDDHIELAEKILEITKKEK